MTVPFVILAALGLLAIAPVSATPIAREPELMKEAPTCDGKDQDTKFTFSTPGGAYDIICGNDYFGGDLTSSTADSFEACLLDCDKTDGCISVSYQGIACYMKNGLKTAVAAPSVTTAKKQGASTSPSTPPTDSSLTCENKASHDSIYEAANGEFKILCGQEYAGGDINSVGVARFEDCIKACDTTDECIDVSYVNGACYLKRSTATLVTADWVWTAVLQNPTANAISCVDNVNNGATYTAKTGGAYKIECGIDYAGGDLKTLDTATIELCMDACDRTDGCVDVSFVYGTCYLKNAVNPNATPLDYVWTGRQVKTAEQAALQYLEANGGAFCSSFIAYEPPVTVVQSTTTPDASTVASTTTFLTTSVRQLTATVTSVAATVTLPRAPLRKRVEATPSPISAWPASRISSACSKIATGLSTSVSVATASVDPKTAVITEISVIQTTATTTTTKLATTTTAAPARMTLGVNTDFETGNLNNWRQTQMYSNLMSANIINGGDNSPRALQLSHNGGGIARVFLSQAIPASALNKWFRVEFSTMYTRDNGQNDNTCSQTFTWNGRVQGTIYATTGLLRGTSRNQMPNTRCSENYSLDNIPRPRPGVWARHTAWFQAKNLVGSLHDLELTARCDSGAPAQSMYFDNIRVVEEDC